jgi:hypothetical protein
MAAATYLKNNEVLAVGRFTPDFAEIWYTDYKKKMPS